MSMGIALGLLGGLALLIGGAEFLVRGASGIATAFGVPPLLIGLTVVAYGTSAPELAVSLGAGLRGQADLALANVVGSNVFNALAVVGSCALVAPLAPDASLVRRELPLLLLVTVGAMALAVDRAIGRGDGILLLAGLAALTASQARAAATGRPAAKQHAAPTTTGRRSPPRTDLRHSASILAGLVALTLGARWLVSAASAGAAALGVGELIVGLTVVATGTSLPELATSIVAAVRGQRDIALGNVVGSNAFNLLGILGLSAALAPDGLPVAPQVVALDGWVVLGATALLLPLARTGAAIVRWEGAVLLASYAAYLGAVVAIAVGRLQVPPAWLAAVLVAVPVALSTGPAFLRRRTPPP